MEMQLERASNAEFWVNGQPWTSLASMLADEPRYVEFRAFRQGNVWQPYNNDYWSRSVTRPDLMLADLIKIFHPDLARDHDFVWYRRVPQDEE
jgi:iron complex transport system substrate-binding protein